MNENRIVSQLRAIKLLIAITVGYFFGKYAAETDSLLIGFGCVVMIITIAIITIVAEFK